MVENPIRTDAPPSLAAETIAVGQAIPAPVEMQPPIAPVQSEIMVESVNAVLSSVERLGDWEAADELRIRAIGGAIHLDFTQATMPLNGTVEIHIQCIAGDVKITVPEDADVVLEATPILGSVEQRVGGTQRTPHDPADSAGRGGLAEEASTERPPSFLIFGTALCGTIRILSG